MVREGDYLRAMDSLREIMLHRVWSEVLPWTDRGDHFGGNQELASSPGCMTVLGTRLAQEYITGTRIFLNAWAACASFKAENWCH